MYFLCMDDETDILFDIQNVVHTFSIIYSTQYIEIRYLYGSWTHTIDIEMKQKELT